MGLFDYVRCKYPLPVAGAEGLEFQTKDTPSQYMDLYEIREDGSLWHETYDIVDRSDPSKEGFERLRGAMARINNRWEFCKLTGEVVFYTGERDWWIEFSSYFKDGKLQQMNLLEHRKGNPAVVPE